MHQTQRDIVKFLRYRGKARFSRLRRFTGLSSNELSYHLNQLLEKDIAFEENEHYRLSEKGKSESLYAERGSIPMTVVLIVPVKNDQVMLMRREKELFKNMFALPSKILEFGDTPENSINQIKANYDLKLGNVNFRKTFMQIDHDDEPVHHFTFLVHEAEPENTPENAEFFDKDDIEDYEEIVPTAAKMVKRLEKPGLEVLEMNVSGEKPELLYD